MKPKDYIKKYKLEKGWNPKVQEKFLQDLTSELLAFLEYNKAADNIKGFENSVKVIRTKWDSISNKIPYGLPEGLWSYFWATTVVILREKLCPKEVARRKRIAEERKAAREEKKKEQQELYGELFLMLLISTIPTDSFNYLGLPTSATVDEIKQKYRELSLKMHPDRGGSQEAFIELTEHKNKALKWASR